MLEENLKVNASKTYIFERIEMSQCNIGLHGEELEIVDEFRYLGVNCS